MFEKSGFDDMKGLYMRQFGVYMWCIETAKATMEGIKMISRAKMITMIKETTDELRRIENEINGEPSHFRYVRLTDRKWDLEARYAMLMRKSGQVAA